jgi:hypothetical protein
MKRHLKVGWIKRSGSTMREKNRRTMFATVDPLRLIHPTTVRTLISRDNNWQFDKTFT